MSANKCIGFLFVIMATMGWMVKMESVMILKMIYLMIWSSQFHNKYIAKHRNLYSIIFS